MFSGGRVGLSAGGGTGSIVGNHFVDSDSKGFDVGFGGAILIADNEFLRNGRNPLPFEGDIGGLIASRMIGTRPIEVRNNLAQNNGGYGIMVDTGAITDGGDNRSIGDERPCKGVVCASG
jgi:hypothetical protein